MQGKEKKPHTDQNEGDAVVALCKKVSRPAEVCSVERDWYDRLPLLETLSFVIANEYISLHLYLQKLRLCHLETRVVCLPNFAAIGILCKGLQFSFACSLGMTMVVLWTK